nr:hypothetical protein [Tanacetum cinerariifolium]
MTTLAEYIIVVGAENRPLMLEKSMYDSWASHIRLFINGKKNDRMMLDSIDNGLLVYPTVVGKDGQTRPKIYSELTEAQQLQDDCDVQQTNIILHSLPPDVKFVIDVKLAKSLYTTNYDQLYAYLSQHELHANKSPQHSGSSMYPLPQQFTPIYKEPIHHQHHHTPLNPQQQSVSPQPFISPSVTQQSQAEFLNWTLVSLFQYFSKERIRLNVSTKQWHSYLLWHQGFHLRTINSERLLILEIKQPFKTEEEKLTLVKAQEAGQIFDEEQLAFLTDPEIEEAQVAQQTIPQNSTFQTEDLDAYDSDCDDISSAKAVLMKNLSSCDSNVLSNVPYSDTYLNDMINQDDTNSSAPNDLLVLSFVKQMTDHVANLYEENQTNKMVNESLTAELERYKERVAIFKQRQNVDLNKREKLIDSQMDDLIRNKNAKLAAFQQEIDTLKQTLSNHAQLIKPTLNDGSVIAKKHDVISMIDDEETLILEEESRSKMLDKQDDPISIKQKIKISPIDDLKLNNLKEDFGKHFVTQQELSAEQAFWLKHSSNFETPAKSHTHVRIEAPSKLPKVSLANESLKKLKYHLASFDKVVKKRTTSDAITADEITKVKNVFNQMEAAVDQCSVDKNDLEIQIKQLRIDSDQLLNQIMSQEIVHIVVNSVDVLDVSTSSVNECNKCLVLDTEIFKKKDFIEKDVYDKLVKSYSTLEKHCNSLELATQLNQEIFQKDNSRVNQNGPTFNQLFKIIKLKAQSQEKDTVIRKLKDIINL